MVDYECVSLEELFGPRRKSEVVFMSGISRPLYPAKIPFDRLGNSTAPIRGSAHTGPGCYDVAEKTTRIYEMENCKSESNRGYTFASRTGPRIVTRTKEITPSPDAYQPSWSDRSRISQSAKPFLSGCSMGKQNRPDCCPGPGAYEHELKLNRNIAYLETFGSRRTLRDPSVNLRIKDRTLSKAEFKKLQLKEAYFRLYY